MPLVCLFITLLRELKKMGLNNHRAAKVPWLSPASMKKRVAFAKANMNTDWTQVHPMAESIINP